VRVFMWTGVDWTLVASGLNDITKSVPERLRKFGYCVAVEMYNRPAKSDSYHTFAS
jgi:hypothetical protein